MFWVLPLWISSYTEDYFQSKISLPTLCTPFGDSLYLLQYNFGIVTYNKDP